MRSTTTGRGFTLLEMVIAVTILSTGMVYVFSTFADTTTATQSAALGADLGGQNKKALTRLFNELQGTSTVLQDTDGLDGTAPESVFSAAPDATAPRPFSAPRSVTRTSGDPDTVDGTLQLGAGEQRAREKTIPTQTLLRFRKVKGYVFKAATGAVVPEWTNWVTYRVGPRRRLLRTTQDGQSRVVALNVDAFDVSTLADGSLVVTLVTARRNPGSKRLIRYANSVSIVPKN